MKRLANFALKVLGRRRKGQVLPLAAFGLFVMVIAIVATMNLGQAVYEKIRLQNAADSAAYSLAAMEARAFNFVALTNRAQVVHYNSALAIQSYLSYAGFIVALSGTMRDMFNVVRSVADVGCSTIPPPGNAPYCAAARIAQAMAAFANVFAQISERAYRVLHDYFAPQAVEAMVLFNKYAIWQMQLIRLALVNSHLLTGMYEFLAENDPSLELGSRSQLLNLAINALLNSLEFRSAFDASASVNPFLVDLALGFHKMKQFEYDQELPDERKEAISVMAEIVNASRHGDFVYDRWGMVGASLLVGNIAGIKQGQTKLVQAASLGPKIDEIREDPINYPFAKYLASDDFLTAAAGGVFVIGPAAAILLPGIGTLPLGDGIYADRQGGRHYKYHSPGGRSPGAPRGMVSVVGIPFPPLGVRRTQYEETDKKHHFKMAPFFKFKATADPYGDFNQPSTWIFLNKHHKDFQTSGEARQPWYFKFTWQRGGQPMASLDTTIGGDRSAVFLEGLNAIARGMVYYHRPGDWAETPNFFNPFWRARLAPVGDKLKKMWDERISSRMTSSSDNPLIRGLVNFLRNLIGDVFFRIVTSVITH